MGRILPKGDHPVLYGAGMQYARPFKDQPGGFFPAKNDRIIDTHVWRSVQAKMANPDKTRVSIDENLPLRGLLKCHCGNLLSGAPSKGRHGGWYYYYKCRHAGHNNISVKKSHKQLVAAWHLMSLPDKRIKEIKSDSEADLNRNLSNNV
jgi:hypothetical protein